MHWAAVCLYVLQLQGLFDLFHLCMPGCCHRPTLLSGFVESFNISVAAALIMYEAQQQRVRKFGQAGDLTVQQQQQLLAAFLLRGVVSSGATQCM